MLGMMMFYFGLATLVTGTIGMLASHHLARLVSYSLVVSTGILLAALGLGLEALTAPVLFYLIVSALTAGTFFMLTGMTDRTRTRCLSRCDAGASPHVRSRRSIRRSACASPTPMARTTTIGVAIPRAMAFLGLMFVSCVLLVTGLPPLPGFIAKFALLSTAIAAAPAAGLGTAAWTLCDRRAHQRVSPASSL